MFRQATCSIAVLLVTILAACGDGGDGLCGRLDGSDFQSAEPISQLLGPEGLEPSYVLLEFTGEEMYWYYSDVVESGEWSCDGDRLDAFDGRFEADLTEEDGRLVLTRAGDRYLANPDPP